MTSVTGGTANQAETFKVDKQPPSTVSQRNFEGDNQIDGLRQEEIVESLSDR